MLPTGIAEPEQLETLFAALDEHCNEFGIDKTDAAVREDIAIRIILLFMSGINSLPELKRALRSDRLM